MDAHLSSIASRCLNAAYDNTMTFPEIVGALSEAGFEGYAVDYRGKTTTYYLSDGDHCVLENRTSDDAVAADFDATGIAAQIRWAQLNPPDYAYATFCKNVRAAGCAGYLVSFAGRRVLYFGRTAEIHIEHFPS